MPFFGIEFPIFVETQKGYRLTFCGVFSICLRCLSYSDASSDVREYLPSFGNSFCRCVSSSRCSICSKIENWWDMKSYFRAYKFLNITNFYISSQSFCKRNFFIAANCLTLLKYLVLRLRSLVYTTFIFCILKRNSRREIFMKSDKEMELFYELWYWTTLEKTFFAIYFIAKWCIKLPEESFLRYFDCGNFSFKYKRWQRFHFRFFGIKLSMP